MRERLFGNWRQPHTRGYLWDNLTAGLVFTTNTYLNLGLLRAATEAAGCKGNPSDDDYTCSSSTRGLKPSSWLTAVATAGALLGAVLTPVVGTFSDYSVQRRLVGATSAWVLALVSLSQATITKATWFYVALLQIPSLASYVVHQGTVLSYLPGLSRIDGSDDDDESVRFRVNACSVVAAFGTQIGGLACFGVVAIVFGIGVVNVAALVQLIVGIALVLIYLFIWHPSNGYGGAFVDVPALKPLPADLVGSTNEAVALLTATIRELVSSYRFLRDHFPNVTRFLAGYALCNASMSSFASLAIVFLNDHLKLDPTQTIAVVLALLIASVPSAFVGARIMKRHGARRTFLAMVLGMCGTTAVAGLVLLDASAALLIYPFAVVWGFHFGTYYAANTSFFTQLVPMRSESQFMAYFYGAAVVLNWAPPALFTVINQLTNATLLVFYIISAFFAVAYPLIRSVDVAAAKRDIAAYESACASSNSAANLAAEDSELATTTARDDAAAGLSSKSDKIVAKKVESSSYSPAAAAAAGSFEQQAISPVSSASSSASVDGRFPRTSAVSPHIESPVAESQSAQTIATPSFHREQDGGLPA
ncbi:hypothetical protein CTAYLR_007883 [Chrysophaeum taylorii]|uniref:Uncharacterized protein n=1 Tax=Chrysophaeum taylorii TaxID=2483200 RepID=A0AAD7ULF4_9STRA|nr:hypothetical protein CTAYLR_007883 [Chrysophaeum taylorii]